MPFKLVATGADFVTDRTEDVSTANRERIDIQEVERYGLMALGPREVISIGL